MNDHSNATKYSTHVKYYTYEKFFIKRCVLTGIFLYEIVHPKYEGPMDYLSETGSVVDQGGTWASVSPQTGWSPQFETQEAAIKWLNDRGYDVARPPEQAPADTIKIQTDVVGTFLSILGTADKSGIELLDTDASAVMAIHLHLLERMPRESKEYTMVVGRLKTLLETGATEISLATRVKKNIKKLLTLGFVAG
jgi:hypothetical protein